MLRFLGFLFLLVAGVGTWGWCKGWFTVEVNREVMARDLEGYEQKFHEFVVAVDDKISSLRDRAKSANAKTRTDLEREIQELERKKGEANESLEELKKAPPEERSTKKKKLDETLDSQPKKDGER